MVRGKSLNTDAHRALSFARSLVGAPYVWWNGGDLRGNRGPFWADDGKIPPVGTIRSQGCSCAGLINLMRRRMGLCIPGLERGNYRFAGGTDCWFRYLREKGVLQVFEGARCYPKGTLLLRPYKNVLDQGHLAVVYGDHTHSVLYAKLLHCYPLSPIPQPGKTVPGGIRVDPAVGISHFWKAKGFYTHICLVKDWLGSTS